MGKTKDYKLQIPISNETKEMLEFRTEEVGFSSVPEVVRFLINQFVRRSIDINMSTNEYIEVPNEYTRNEILEGLKDLEEGRVKEFDPEDPGFHEKVIKFANE